MNTNQKFNFSDLIYYYLKEYLIYYDSWEFIVGKYDNLVWNMDEFLNEEWDNISDISNEDDWCGYYDENVYKYDSDVDSQCSTPYSIIDYGK